MHLIIQFTINIHLNIVIFCTLKDEIMYWLLWKNETVKLAQRQTHSKRRSYSASFQILSGTCITQFLSYKRQT